MYYGNMFITLHKENMNISYEKIQSFQHSLLNNLNLFKSHAVEESVINI